MKLGAFADAHCGAYPQFADDRLAEQEAVLAHAVDVFNEENVDAILFAGDATHRNKPDPAELLAFVRPLLAAHAPILAISGNKHDVGNTLGPIALELLDERVNGLIRLSRTPEIIPLGELRVATLPHASTQQLRASMNGGGDPENIDQWAAEHLLSVAEGLRRRIPDGCGSVLLTHFAISGDEDGLAKLVREPVLPLEGLEALGFDAIVAGHFHRPQLLGDGMVPGEIPGRSLATPGSRNTAAQILYCGSPYPLNFSEGDYEHGVWLVDVEPGSAAARFVPLASRGFVTVDADLTWLPEGVDVTDCLVGHVQAVTG